MDCYYVYHMQADVKLTDDWDTTSIRWAVAHSNDIINIPTHITIDDYKKWTVWLNTTFASCEDAVEAILEDDPEAAIQFTYPKQDLTN